MTKKGFFVLGGPEMQLHDILWAVHDGKNRGRSEGKENFREFSVTVGGRGPSDAHFSRTYAHVYEALGSNCTRLRRWALTEPERLHCKLRVTEPEQSIDPLLLTEPE